MNQRHTTSLSPASGWLVRPRCRCVIPVRYRHKILWFYPGLGGVGRPTPLPPFCFRSLSAVSCVLRLTLIPNRYCHLCLANTSDYSSRVCHRNPLFQFSSAQHVEQLLLKECDVKLIKNLLFKFPLLLRLFILCPSVRWKTKKGSEWTNVKNFNARFPFQRFDVLYCFVSFTYEAKRCP